MNSLSHLSTMTWVRSLVVLCLLALSLSGAACWDSAPTGVAAGAETTEGRSVVVRVRTALSVQDVERSAERVRKLVEKHDGIVATSNLYGSEDNRIADFEVRIPAEKLEAFRSELAGVGEVEADSEQVEDVTAPHADLKARLHNARAHEKRLLTLLEEKTGNLADVVAIEKELASVRENIERMEAEERVLDRRIAYATVNISLRPSHTQLWSHPVAAIGNAFGTGIRGARNMVVGGAIVAATVLPSLVVLAAAAALMFLLVRALLRRRSRRAATRS